MFGTIGQNLWNPFPARSGYTPWHETSIFANALLSVIALCLGVLTAQSIHDHLTVVHAAAPPTWEYTAVIKSYQVKNYGFTGTTTITRDDVPLQGVSILSVLMQLGSQGWDLVAVVPSSDEAGTSWGSFNSTLGPYQGSAFNGVTTSETWVFKRPK
jgi:hypothetical protein